MKPIMPYHVTPGADYWAAWGSKGWSAVRVKVVKRKFAKVSRVDPKTNEVKTRTAKVRLDELVKRDPSQEGRDRPEDGPAEVFADVRSHRELAENKQLMLQSSRTSDEADDSEELTEEEIEARRVERARTAEERWDRVEAHFGKEVVDQWETDEDW